MAQRYVPPALRSVSASHPAPLATDASLQRSLGDLDLTESSPKQRIYECASFGQLYTIDEIHKHFCPQDYSDRSTLNDSTERPGQLAYVVIFLNAHPRWSSHHLIFVKSHLEMLPLDIGKDGYLPDMSQADGQTIGDPIAIFKQVKHGKDRRQFCFDDWYNVEKIDRLEPQTHGLIRMLEQKWNLEAGSGEPTQTEHSSQAWQRNMAQDWAIVQMQKLEEQLPKPIISVSSTESDIIVMHGNKVANKIYKSKHFEHGKEDWRARKVEKEEGQQEGTGEEHDHDGPGLPTEAD